MMPVSIEDVISFRHLGLYGHVARLDSDVPARDALDVPVLAVLRYALRHKTTRTSKADLAASDW